MVYLTGAFRAAGLLKMELVLDTLAMAAVDVQVVRLRGNIDTRATVFGLWEVTAAVRIMMAQTKRQVYR